MAIVTKGSGGSIKFTGTGGGISITSSGGGGGGGGGPADPSLTSLMAWYRADDIGLSNGASVTSWVDRQGPSDLTYVYGSNITFNASSAEFNNQPTVNFVNYNYLDASNNPSRNFGDQGAANTIVMVVKPTYTGEWASLIMETRGQYPYAGRGYKIYKSNQAGGSSIFLSGYNAAGRIWRSVEPNKPIIIYISYERETNVTQNSFQIFGASSTYEPSLSSEGIGTSAVIPLEGAPSDFLISGGGQPDEIAEVLFYNALQNPQEKTDTIAYLSSRYGIPV